MKKLIKELNKLLPEGWEVTNDFGVDCREDANIHFDIKRIEKEPKLMLGDYEVEIFDKFIKFNEVSITKDEWMKWYNVVKVFYSSDQQYASFEDLKLGRFETESSGDDYITIGYGNKVEINQLEAITNKLKELS